MLFSLPFTLVVQCPAEVRAPGDGAEHTPGPGRGETEGGARGKYSSCRPSCYLMCKPQKAAAPTSTQQISQENISVALPNHEHRDMGRGGLGNVV